MKIDSKFTDFKVADLALADWGRKEIAIAESEMPALMAIRKEFAARAAAEGRAHRRLAAHDDPDRGADRDAEGARRRGALGLVQHLLDPGPRRGGDRRERHRRCSPTRASRSTSTGSTRTGSSSSATQGPNMILDDGGDATLLVHLGPRAAQGRRRCSSNPTSEEEVSLFNAIKKSLAGRSRLVLPDRQGHQGRDRGDHHRRAPPLPDGEGEAAAVPGDQRQRLGDQVEVRQHLRLPRVAGRRHQARDRRDGRGQGRGGRAATARSARARRRRCAGC